MDALEGMRTRGFPDEQITTKRYEILLRFTHGVCDPILRQELAVVKAAESYLADPPTVESLGFTTRQLQRYRPLPGKTYGPRYAMRSRPHPLMPRKIIHPEPRMPQNVLPYPQMQQYMKPVLPKPSTPSVKQILAPDPCTDPCTDPSTDPCTATNASSPGKLFQLWTTKPFGPRMPE